MNSPRQRPRVLITAASEHGSTTEIARGLGQTLINDGIAADIVPPDAVDSIEDYDAVILGSAVYEGHWLAPARDFAVRLREPLTARSVWLFSSGPVGGPSGKLVQPMEQEPADVIRIRQDIGVRGHRIFAGQLNPHVLGLGQRAAIRMHHGVSGDFRDWAVIAQWADEIAADLAAFPQG